jgi:ureidoglycolate lyase
MTRDILIEAMEASAFAPFGDLLEVAGAPDKIINQGLCGRWHDRARIDILDGAPGISLFQSQARSLPLTLAMVERHPLGSQAFLPMSLDPFLVVVAPDEGGSPGLPRAFRTAPGQGINIARNIWHGVLTPLHAPGLFAVIDRIGAGSNLEEHWFHQPFTLHDA